MLHACHLLKPKCHAYFFMYICSLYFFCVNNSLADENVWAKLAEGGKVVLMRHSSVNRGNGLLRDPFCKQEPSLSNKGEREARIIGERFRKHQIQISEVRHSPFCRTSDTAKIAFGGGTPAQYLSLLEILSPDEAARQSKQLSQIIGSYNGTGNLILIL